MSYLALVLPLWRNGDPNQSTGYLLLINYLYLTAVTTTERNFSESCTWKKSCCQMMVNWHRTICLLRLRFLRRCMHSLATVSSHHTSCHPIPSILSHTRNSTSHDPVIPDPGLKLSLFFCLRKSQRKNGMNCSYESHTRNEILFWSEFFSIEWDFILFNVTQNCFLICQIHKLW